MIKFPTELKCSYFPLCSGCEYQGDVSAPPVYKELAQFFLELDPNLNFSLTLAEVTHWRCRSKLAVRGTSRHPEIGLFKKGSHDVVSIPLCPLHHPAINEVCQRVLEAIIDCKVDPYCEETGNGILRYLQFVVERKTGKVQLTLVLNQASKDPHLEDFVKQLYNKLKLHSIWMNFQPTSTNKIFGEEWALCHGEPYLWEKLGGIDCAFHPACFGQAHLSLFERVLEQIRQWILPNQKIIELYAGIGVIGLNLAEQSQQVVCVEINPYSAECFTLSRNQLSSSSQQKITMHIAPSEEAANQLVDKDVIIVDPPRKGLDLSVLEMISASQASQLIYLSCGPKSFQRDCKALIAKGWQVDKAQGFLFFPGLDHVEVLCSFKR